jgi:hypothetical protein
MNNTTLPITPDDSIDLELDALLHPARAFAHPRDVVMAANLSLDEKRAILASWASDACAVEAAPALRCAPGTRQPVPVDDILEALRALDLEANALRTQASRRVAHRFRRGGPHDPGGSARASSL